MNREDLEELHRLCGPGSLNALRLMEAEYEDVRVWEMALETIRRRPPRKSALGYLRAILRTAAAELLELDRAWAEARVARCRRMLGRGQRCPHCGASQLSDVDICQWALALTDLTEPNPDQRKGG